MSIRRTIVEVDLDGLNVAEFCRQHGVSTWLFYELRRRFQAEGEAGLEPRSRAPKRVANRTRAEIEDHIVALRKQLEADGLDAGPATIRYHLQRTLRDRKGTRTPSEATIWRVLQRRGFVVAQPRKAPQHAHRTFTAQRANECWQIDDTWWTLADGRVVKILNIIDDRTRVLVSSRAVPWCTTAVAVEAFVAGAAEWGWPERYLSDNASPLRCGLRDALAPLGVAAGHSRPHHPQTCGKVERFHQTLKKHLAALPPAETLADLQAQLDRFRALYNHERPHRALGRRSPADVWAETPKSGPASQPIAAPTLTYHGKVMSNGRVCAGRRYEISLGVAHTGATATIVVTGLACHVFIEGRLVRALTLDPSRRNQNLYDRPGPPRRLV